MGRQDELICDATLISLEWHKVVESVASGGLGLDPRVIIPVVELSGSDFGVRLHYRCWQRRLVKKW